MPCGLAHTVAPAYWTDATYQITVILLLTAYYSNLRKLPSKKQPHRPQKIYW